MIGPLGSACLFAALVVAIWGATASALGAAHDRDEWIGRGRAAAFAMAALATAAVLLMEIALVSHDFSVRYVAEVGSTSTPTPIAMISLWAALEGSILFWLWVLTLYTALVAWMYRDARKAEVAYATAVMMGVASFFLLVLVFFGNPFTLSDPVPLEGPGPNPLLQNHPLMALHPPAQYLGYVGFTVPFAFAIASLLTGRVDGWWASVTRRWTLVSWGFLTLAIAGGAWWAYEVLGWGGYWAWDPVENASLMPWLVATAFLHTLMVQERREMLRTWNVTLIIATFALTILGTFLTRSGVLGSVHAFTQSPTGPVFLTFLGAVVVGSTALIIWRGSRLATPGSLDSLRSREAAIVASDLLFVCLTFTVLLGTVFPLVAEALRGTKVSVGAPYFNGITVPFFAALIFLMGVGPALPWRRPKEGALGRRFQIAALWGVFAGLGAWTLGVDQTWPLVTVALCGFTASVMGLEVFAALRLLVSKGYSPFGGLYRLLSANPRRYGGYIVHFGVLVVAVAVAASWNFRTEREVTLQVGESVVVDAYTLTLQPLELDDEGYRRAVSAPLTVAVGDRPAAQLDPRMNYYRFRPQPIPTPAVRSTVVEDLFTTLMAYDESWSSATLRIVVTPLVVWLWIGAGIMALGTVVALGLGHRSRKPSTPAPQPSTLHPDPAGRSQRHDALAESVQ